MVNGRYARSLDQCFNLRPRTRGDNADTWHAVARVFQSAPPREGRSFGKPQGHPAGVFQSAPTARGAMA
jgi:hypothetical protein